MADHNEVAYTTADGNDYVAHEQTYEGFIMLVKYGTAADFKKLAAFRLPNWFNPCEVSEFSAPPEGL
jgi:hypothetical protein